MEMEMEKFKTSFIESSTSEYCLKDNIGFVRIEDIGGDEKKIINAARISFNAKIEKIEEKDKELLCYLLENGHFTPFEHTMITFHVKAPLFVARQWFRHRIASYNEISGRYSKIKNEFYIPQNLKNKKNYIQHCEKSFALYKEMIDQEIDKEEARAILPLSTYTEFYFTCNLRALLHFFELRLAENAQWEIRQYAKRMYEITRPYFPNTFQYCKL